MNKNELKRNDVIEKTADHLLVHGIRETSLRKLAADVGMSDRMLMHYFTDKGELITAALVVVAARLVKLLSATHPEPMPYEKLIAYLAQVMKHPDVRPYLRLSLELASLSSAGEEAYKTIARRLCDDFLDWTAAAIHVNREEDRMPMAALAFAFTEGMMVLDALASEAIITEALKGISICE